MNFWKKLFAGMSYVIPWSSIPLNPQKPPRKP